MRQAAILVAPFMLMIGLSLTARAADPTVTVTQGVLIGTTDHGVSAFLGVPFAAPPVGDRRWAPPRPPAGWGSEPRQARAFGAACTQTLAANGRAPWTSEYMSPEAPGVSEDCLYLNIWTPATLTGSARPAANLPVLFWIYGGGFNEGSGAVPVYNGANLAKKGLIVVNVNYRVGSLGFMAHPELTAEQGGASGNYGIQDQIAALQWVRDNIKAFGGDAAKVTIAGQSAGAMSVQALLVSPVAKGLFRGAIIQSPAAPGTNGTYTPRVTAEQAAVAALGARGRALDRGGARAAGRAGQRRRRPRRARGRRPHHSRVDAAHVASDVPVMTGYTLNDLFVSRRAARRPRAGRPRSRSVTAIAPPSSCDSFRATPTSRPRSRRSARPSIARFNLKLVDWLAARGVTKPVVRLSVHPRRPGPESARYGAFHTSEVPYEFDTLASVARTGLHGRRPPPGRRVVVVRRELREDRQSERRISAAVARDDGGQQGGDGSRRHGRGLSRRAGWRGCADRGGSNRRRAQVAAAARRNEGVGPAGDSGPQALLRQGLPSRSPAQTAGVHPPSARRLRTTRVS